MKPVNDQDLYRAYRHFLLLFILLVIFGITGVYFFFLTSDQEVLLLNKKVKETDRLIAARNNINNDFEQVMLRMQQLSDYTKMSAEELNNQSLLLNDIQTANQRIQDKIQENQLPLKSFQLYQKLSNNINTAAIIKDSLFTTRFQIESAKTQLESCGNANKSAVNKLKSGY